MEKGAVAAEDANARFKRGVYEKLIGRKELAKLRTDQIKHWRNAQVSRDDDEEAVRRSKATANRNLTALKPP